MRPIDLYVYAYFRRWIEDGTLERWQEHLRAQVRRQVGKQPTPSVVVLDSEKINTTDKGGNRAGGHWL